MDHREDDTDCGRSTDAVNEDVHSEQIAVAAPPPTQDIFGDSSLSVIFVFFALLAWISDYFRARNCTC